MLARRYLRGREGFHSVIAWISLIGLTLGAAVLIVVLSVMNGFERELKLRILGVVPHVLLYRQDGAAVRNWKQAAEAALALDGVEEASPFLEGYGMAIGRRSEGLYFQGVEPEYEERISVMDDFMVAGTLRNLKSGEFSIVLGATLARQLGVGIGDRITLMVPKFSSSLAGVRPLLRRFTVVGLFQLESELDRQLAMVHLDDGAALLRSGGAKALRLRLENLFDAPRRQRQLADALEDEIGGGTVWPANWTYNYGTLFNAIQLERRMVALMLSLIIGIAAFNVLASLVMSVDSRRAEIAILRTMGVTKARIVRIFMLQGLIIGANGTVAGLLLGLAIASQMEAIAAWVDSLVYQFSGEALFNAYFIHYLPSEIKWSQVPTVGFFALGLSWLAAVFPALRAMRLRPAEVLRYE